MEKKFLQQPKDFSFLKTIHSQIISQSPKIHKFIIKQGQKINHPYKSFLNYKLYNNKGYRIQKHILLPSKSQLTMLLQKYLEYKEISWLIIQNSCFNDDSQAGQFSFIKAQISRIQITRKYQVGDQGRLEHASDFKLTGDLFFRDNNYDMAYERYKSGINLFNDVSQKRIKQQVTTRYKLLGQTLILNIMQSAIKSKNQKYLQYVKSILQKKTNLISYLQNSQKSGKFFYRKGRLYYQLVYKTDSIQYFQKAKQLGVTQAEQYLRQIKFSKVNARKVIQKLSQPDLPQIQRERKIIEQRQQAQIQMFDY